MKFLFTLPEFPDKDFKQTRLISHIFSLNYYAFLIVLILFACGIMSPAVHLLPVYILITGTILCWR